MVELLKLVKPYWIRVVGIILSSLVVSGTTAAMAWAIKYYIDDVLIKTDPFFSTVLPFVFIMLFFVKGLFSFAQRYLSLATGAKIIMGLRKSLYGHLITMPLGFFHKNPSGSLISRILNDTNVIKGNLVDGSKGLFVEGFTVVALLGVAFWRRWDLTLLTIVVLPAAFYAVSRISANVKAVSHRGQKRIANLTDVLTETFGAIKIIKAFLLERLQSDAFDHENRNYYRLELKNVRLIELAALLMDVVAGIGVGFVIWYGGHLARTGQMTPGDFTSYIAAVMLVFTPMKRLAMVSTKLNQAMAAYERITDLLKKPQEEDGDIDLPVIRGELVFEDVHLKYDGSDNEAVAGIDLSVRVGEVVALVGRSGAGKTSLVDLIPGFFRPSKGRILIDGNDIGKARVETLRRQVGIVSQEIILFDDTLRNNIAFGAGKADCSFEKIQEAAKAAYAHDFIMELPAGYDTQIGERGVMLSGGQRQRISIARAVLKNPAILILDEATSALDTASEAAVQKALENLMQNRTTFVIAHRLSTVRRADRIVVMDRGRIVEMGTHEELLERSGVYAELNRMQLR